MSVAYMFYGLYNIGGVHYLNHPRLTKGIGFRRCIPLGLHGDGTPCMGVGKAWGKMVDAWTWHSLLVSGHSLLTMMLIFCIHSALRSTLAGKNTLDRVFGMMAWSFAALDKGEWPTLDWLGRKIETAKALLL